MKIIIQRALKMYMSRLNDISHETDISSMGIDESDDSKLRDAMADEKYAVAKIATGLKNGKITINHVPTESFARNNEI
jgi:hypothetical protein